ncbi:MAG: UDP-N-acetylglucosamine 2-epimerase (non-hydrolyzing) [Anaerovorax sp.]
MKVMTVFGTRPEAIKMAPLVKALNETQGIDSVLCVTAQHREMLDQVLELFQLTPDYDLNIMKPNQTISQITANVITGIEEVFIKEKPDLVLVHGDTTTTFATSLAAFYQQIKVGHVEAGLRTYDKYSPWPEEINRVLTGHIADLHFSPTERNRQNLLREAIDDRSIFITGNTVIDALLEVMNKPYEFEEPTLKNLDFVKKRVIAVTCHRRENLGENMHNIFNAIKDIVLEFDDVEVVYPMHMNPKVREIANEILGIVSDRIHLIEPLQYQPFVNLMAKSYFIITDSGGMQEEAPSIGKPVLVVRKETERPEALEAGTVKLAGVERESIYAMAKELLTDGEAYEKMAHAENPYGDGTACKQIVAILLKEFGGKMKEAKEKS